MSKINWVTVVTMGIAVVETIVCGKQIKKINKLEGKVESLENQLEQTIKKAMQQSYHNGRNAERAANIEEK